MRTPDLIQRCNIKDSYSTADSVDGRFVFDYMGSSEFEWGAKGKSIRAMAPKDLKIHMVQIFQHKVYLLCEDSELDQYTLWLYELSRNAIRTKEATGFGYHWKNGSEYTSYNGKGPDMWWDIENHVAWSLRKDIVENFQQALPISVKKRDAAAEAKAKK
jgi:hypothetical protein